MTKTQWNQLVQSDVDRLMATVMTKRLVREANHQSLCALCEAVRAEAKYSHIYPLTR
jgi:hypothetical protein